MSIVSYNTAILTSLILVIILQIIMFFLFYFTSKKRNKNQVHIKKSVDIYTQAFNLSPAYMMIIEGESGKIVDANSCFMDLAGSDVVGKDIHKAVSADSRTTFASIISGTHILSGTPDEHELSFTLGDSRTFIIRRVLFTVGEKAFMLLQMVDISEKVIYRRRLLELDQLERKRIGQELHDGLGQQLAGILYLSEALIMDYKDKTDPHYKDIKQVISLIKGTIDDVRRISRTYFPVKMKTEGLLFCVNDFATYIRSVFGVNVQVSVKSNDLYENMETAMQLYYITLEAVNNAVRHGKAGAIQIGERVENRDKIWYIRDNGSGIADDHKKNGIGFEIMRYRAALLKAQLVIAPVNEGGTEVVIRFNNFYGDE